MRESLSGQNGDGKWLSVECVMGLILHFLVQRLAESGWELMPYRLADDRGRHPSAPRSYVPYLIMEPRV